MEKLRWEKGARKLQQKYLELLGNRLWDIIPPGEWTFLRMKVGYGLYGDPDEPPSLNNKHTGYSAEKLKRIEEVCKKLTEYFHFERDPIFFACLFVIVRVNGTTHILPVFRSAGLSSTQSLSVFVDMRAHCYNSWFNYLTDKTLPAGNYCVPLGGFYEAGKHGRVDLLCYEIETRGDHDPATNDFKRNLVPVPNRMDVRSFNFDTCLEHLVQRNQNDELFLLECHKFTARLLYADNVVTDPECVSEILAHLQTAILQLCQGGMSPDASAKFDELAEMLRGPASLRGNAELILTLRKFKDVRKLFEMLVNRNVDSSQVSIGG